MVRYRLFKQMLLEDWRLHTNLFGATRFALFPVQILAFVAATAGLLTLTSVDPVNVIIGVHALAFLFGLQTGSVAFEGADAMKNVLGDVTYLVFSTRTLPVSQQSLLGIFIVKDIVYYSALFILPITIGLIPLYVYSSLTLAAGTLALLFAALTLSFLFGAGTAVLGIGTFTRGSLGRLAFLAIGVAFVDAWVSDVPVFEYTPYRLYTATTATDVLVAVVPVIVVLVAAVALYSPQQSASKRTSTGQYRRLADALPVSDSVLPAKTLLDVHRSSGGFLKVGMVAGILFAVVAFLIWSLETVIGVTANTGLAYGSLLSLTAFTTHMWITQLDDAESYLFQPVSVKEIFRAKYIAFGVLTAPTGLLFYGGAVLYHGTPVVDAVLGALLFTGLSVYVFGVTMYVAGLDSNDFMFDTGAFTAFSFAVMVAILPVIIVSLLPELSVALTAGVVAWSVLLLVSGGVLAWKAPQRWEAHYL